MEVPHQQAGQQGHAGRRHQEAQANPQLLCAARFLLQASGVGGWQELKARLPLFPLLDERRSRTGHSGYNVRSSVQT